MTLVEFLVAMAVAGVLGAVAVPSLRGLLARRQVDTAVSALMSDFSLARSEAIKRGHSVTICRLGAATASGPSCATDRGSWHEGWLVFDDRDGDGTRGTGEPVLRRQGPLDGIGHLGDRTVGLTLRFVRYRASGMAVGTMGAFVVSTDGTLPDGSRLLCLSAQGRLALRPLGPERDC